MTNIMAAAVAAVVAAGATVAGVVAVGIVWWWYQLHGNVSPRTVPSGCGANRRCAVGAPKAVRWMKVSAVQ